jgi:hypothetical protein
MSGLHSNSTPKLCCALGTLGEPRVAASRGRVEVRSLHYDTTYRLPHDIFVGSPLKARQRLREILEAAVARSAGSGLRSPGIRSVATTRTVYVGARQPHAERYILPKHYCSVSK